MRGLQEAWRVLRPGGQLRLLEPVRPRHALFGAIADRLRPLTDRLLGADLCRDVDTDLPLAGFVVLRVRRQGIWREIVARPDARTAVQPAGPTSATSSDRRDA
jgi:hypothetical protein